MALFSFGQSLKKKFSRTKRGGVADHVSHGSVATKTLSTFSTFNQKRLFAENEIQEKYFFRDDGDEERRIEGLQVVIDDPFKRQEQRNAFVPKALEAVQKVICCDVAVGPSIALRVKEKSCQTKPDVRHRYTDTKDLESFQKNNVNTTDESSEDDDAEFLTKIWKDEWLHALNTRSRRNLLAQIKTLNDSMIVNSPSSNKNEQKSQTLKKHGEVGDEREKMTSGGSDGGFDVNFVLDGFPDLSENRSLMANFVTERLYEKLKDVKSVKNSIGLGQIIQQGMLNGKDERCIGITACDEESFSCFAELLVPIIQEIRPEFKKNKVMPKSQDLKSTEAQIQSIEAIESDFIFEMRITMKRSLKNFPFTSHCNKNQRRIIQTVLADACQNIKGELSGNCWLLDRLSKQEQAMFRDEEKKFGSKLKLQSWKASGISRDWPDGRAIFKGGVQDRLTVVINGEEHLALCLSIYDGNLKNSLQQLLDVEDQIKKSISNLGLEFAWNEKFGNLNTFLPHLGLGCCVASRVLFPSLDGKTEQKSILKKFDLKSNRGSVSKKQGYEIMSVSQFGVSEVDLVEHMTKALNCMTDIEKRLQCGEEYIDVLRKYEIV